MKNSEKREDIGKESHLQECNGALSGGETKIQFFLAECSLKRDLHFQT